MPDALAGEAEPAADFLERLRLGVVEAVAQHENLTLAFLQRQQRCSQGLRAKRDLDLFLRERVVAGDEVPEDRVPCSPTGWSRDAEARAAAFTSSACCNGRLASSAISSRVFGSESSRP